MSENQTYNMTRWSKAPLRYKTNNVAQGVRYWRRFLIEKCLGMFTYTGLPESLPEDEIEMRLITCGFAPIFEATEKGKNELEIVTAYGSIYGVDKYYHATNFVFAQPQLKSKGYYTIGKDVSIIYNSYIDKDSPAGIMPLIDRYASLLAHADSTLTISLVNRRILGLGVASNRQVAESVKSVFNKIQDGEFKTVEDIGIIDNFKTLPYDTGSRQTLDEIMNVKSGLLKAFFEEIGVKKAVNKRERVISDEIATDNQILLINVDDMLENRKKGIESVNKLFGLNVTVELNEDYNPLNLFSDQEEATTNDY